MSGDSVRDSIFTIIVPIFVGLLVDAPARTSSGGLPEYQMSRLTKSRTTLDNADYDLNENAVIQLKDAGVNRNIILAMIDASYNAR